MLLMVSLFMKLFEFGLKSHIGALMIGISH
jgi:hypothetical protein